MCRETGALCAYSSTPRIAGTAGATICECLPGAQTGIRDNTGKQCIASRCGNKMDMVEPVVAQLREGAPDVNHCKTQGL